VMALTSGQSKRRFQAFINHPHRRIRKHADLSFDECLVKCENVGTSGNTFLLQQRLALAQDQGLPQFP
jgi:hypothetical protein